MVDAPCSGEGMFRKDPVALEEWQADTPEQCAIRQKDILAQAVAMLKPGGQLIYSTCTFAPEENEAMMAWLMEEYPFLKSFASNFLLMHPVRSFLHKIGKKNQLA